MVFDTGHAGGPGANIFFDGNATPNPDWYLHFGAAAPGNAMGLCRPSQGAGASQRIGRKVCLKSLFMRWRIKEAKNDSTDPMGSGIRLVIFLDTQSNGALPIASDLFQTTGYGSLSAVRTGGVHSAQFINNIENSQRFRILYDKIVMINSPSVATYNAAGPEVAQGMYRQSKEKMWSKYLRLKNIEIEMAGDTSNPNLCKSNALHCAVTPIGGPIYITGVFRTRFTDV